MLGHHLGRVDAVPQPTGARCGYPHQQSRTPASAPCTRRPSPPQRSSATAVPPWAWADVYGAAARPPQRAAAPCGHTHSPPGSRWSPRRHAHRSTVPTTARSDHHGRARRLPHRPAGTTGRAGRVQSFTRHDSSSRTTRTMPITSTHRQTHGSAALPGAQLAEVDHRPTVHESPPHLAVLRRSHTAAVARNTGERRTCGHGQRRRRAWCSPTVRWNFEPTVKRGGVPP